MKWIQIIGHPITLMILFPCLLVGGDKFALPYAFYLWFSLSTGALYAILGVTGLVVLYAGYQVNRYKSPVTKTLLCIAGLILLVWSLIDFFSQGDYSATFEDTIPLLSFILFFICAICFVWNTAVMAARFFHHRAKQA